MAHLIERESEFAEKDLSSSYVPPVRQRVDAMATLLFGIYPSQKYWGFKLESLKQRLYDCAVKIAPIHPAPLIDSVESPYVYGVDRLEKADMDRFVSNASMAFISLDGPIQGSSFEAQSALKKQHHYEILSLLNEFERISSILFNDERHALKFLAAVKKEVPCFEQKYAYLKIASYVASELGVGRGNITFNKGLNNSFFDQNVAIIGFENSVFDSLIDSGFDIRKINVLDLSSTDDVVSAVLNKKHSKPKV